MKKLRMRKKKKVTPNPYARVNWEKAAILFQQPINSAAQTKSFPSTRQILRLLAAAGSIGLIFAFPGAAPALGSLVLGKKSYPRWQTRKVINQLGQQKYVTIHENDDGSVTVKTTHRGILRALTYQLESMQLKKPRKWDKKWRVVMFDIPDKHKRVRELFRVRLKQLELDQFQESVYISPYPCFDEIEFLRELYGVPFSIKYLLVEKIEDDEFLRTRFELE